MPQDPPGPGAGKRWYAIGRTSTNARRPWAGATVEWTNQGFTVPGGGSGDFIDETLWVTVNNARICWIEVGDGLRNEKDTGQDVRSYYWAENSPDGGYEEHNVNQPAYPPVGAYQRYTIFHQIGGAYVVLIGGVKVGFSDQGGETLHADVGLESTTDKATVLAPVNFRNFEVRDDNQFVPWPNHTSEADAPAWWTWTWPTATNGMPTP